MSHKEETYRRKTDQAIQGRGTVKETLDRSPNGIQRLRTQIARFRDAWEIERGKEVTIGYLPTEAVSKDTRGGRGV